MTTLVMPIVETTQVGQARRAAGTLARAMKFDETTEGRLAVLIVELGNNLIKHGGGGELILQTDPRGVARMLQIWALDRGRGMSNVAECMRDGYSTAGSPGTGLGAVGRLADSFEIYSVPNEGTVVYATISAEKPPVGVRAPCVLAAINVPFPGETVCGDTWIADCDASQMRVMVVDGLGHGLPAEAAATTAIETWQAQSANSGAPVEFLQRAHTALRSTRGAALAVAWINRIDRSVRYAGLGNISATLVSPALKTRSLVSTNGTAGMELRKLQEFNYTYDANTNLIMHSDGLTTRWRFETYPGLAVRHPALIAGVLYRDHKRGRDDATVVVARLE